MQSEIGPLQEEIGKYDNWSQQIDSKINSYAYDIQGLRRKTDKIKKNS